MGNVLKYWWKKLIPEEYRKGLNIAILSGIFIIYFGHLNDFVFSVIKSTSCDFQTFVTQNIFTGNNPPLTESAIQKQPSFPEISTVSVSELRIGQFEVSNAEYLLFVKANPTWQKDHSNIQRYSDSDYLKHWPFRDEFPKGEANHPVTYIPWRAAMDFCKWVGGRLPSFAEWELATDFDKESNDWMANYSKDSSHAPFNFCDRRCLEKVNERDNKPDNEVPEWIKADDGFDETSSKSRENTQYDKNKIYDLYGNVWEWLNDGISGEYRGIAGGSFQSRLIEIMQKKMRQEKRTLSSKDGGFRCVFE